MSKFVIEPNKIYDVNDGSYSFFIRVVDRWSDLDYKVEIAYYPDFDDFSDSDLKFEPAFYNKFELSRLFGPFVLDDSPEADEVEEDEEA